MRIYFKAFFILLFCNSILWSNISVAEKDKKPAASACKKTFQKSSKKEKSEMISFSTLEDLDEKTLSQKAKSYTLEENYDIGYRFYELDKLDQASIFFKQNSEKGHDVSMGLLAEIYAFGTETKKANLEEAKQWMTEAKKLGNPHAEDFLQEINDHVAYNNNQLKKINLILDYLQKLAFPKHKDFTLTSLIKDDKNNKSSAEISAEPSFALGLVYARNSQNIEESINQVLNIFAQAAVDGDIKSQILLALFYTDLASQPVPKQFANFLKQEAIKMILSPDKFSSSSQAFNALDPSGSYDFLSQSADDFQQAHFLELIVKHQKNQKNNQWLSFAEAAQINLSFSKSYRELFSNTSKTDSLIENINKRMVDFQENLPLISSIGQHYLQAYLELTNSRYPQADRIEKYVPINENFNEDSNEDKKEKEDKKGQVINFKDYRTQQAEGDKKIQDSKSISSDYHSIEVSLEGQTNEEGNNQKSKSPEVNESIYKLEQEAIRLLSQASVQGDLSAKFILARHFFYFKKEYKKAFALLKGIQNYSNEVDYLLALMYANGFGVKQNLNMFVYHLTEAAQNNHLRSINYMVMLSDYQEIQNQHIAEDAIASGKVKERIEAGEKTSTIFIPTTLEELAVSTSFLSLHMYIKDKNDDKSPDDDEIKQIVVALAKEELSPAFNNEYTSEDLHDRLLNPKDIPIVESHQNSLKWTIKLAEAGSLPSKLELIDYALYIARDSKKAEELIQELSQNFAFSKDGMLELTKTLEELKYSERIVKEYPKHLNLEESQKPTSSEELDEILKTPSFKEQPRLIVKNSNSNSKTKTETKAKPKNKPLENKKSHLTLVQNTDKPKPSK